MKKTLLAIITLVVLCVFSSAYNTTPPDARIGFKAPNFYITDNDGEISLQKFKGKYVLLTFWTSVDAESRISNMRYDRLAKAHEELQHIAVNYDMSEAVFNEIIKIDGVNTKTQFFDNEGKSSNLSEIYRISSKGFITYLIDPSGEIIAENPSAEMISKFI